jgi:hypothetical protein
MTGRKKGLWGILIAVLVLIHATGVHAEETVIYEEGFEGGLNGWSPDNGVWELCLHNPPNPPWGGELFYVATVCDGNYPATTDSRLISPEIDLRDVEIVGGEELRLRFWHWFSYYYGDGGYVQISEYDEATESWSAFTVISDAIVSSSAVWLQQSIDITAYAGKKVRIAFLHSTSDYKSEVAAGWYVDHVEIIKKEPEWTGDFECGWGDWYTDNGVWEVGTPTSGPVYCYSGTQCAGTVLGGNYPSYADSRLISPSFYLPADGVLSFSFRHWFSYYYGDGGYVQISEYDEATGSWSAFTNISGAIVNSSAVWSPMSVDISAYAGKKVRIAFLHSTSDYNSGVAVGWYIDHIRITGLPHFCECDLNQDTLCDMPDWLIFGSDWGRTNCNVAGTPPCECDLNHDGSCNMLDWLRFGADWGQSDCLICEE